ncbi:hypothetical protein C0995_006324, partial [Termitomyces sp. Mi166
VPPQTREAVDFVVLFKIEHQRIPAMFVELQPFDKLKAPFGRDEVDIHMRRRFRQFFETAPRTFIGLSAFGHMVCKYELRNAEGNRITPPAILKSNNYIIHVPQER